MVLKRGCEETLGWFLFFALYFSLFSSFFWSAEGGRSAQAPPERQAKVGERRRDSSRPATQGMGLCCLTGARRRPPRRNSAKISFLLAPPPGLSCRCVLQTQYALFAEARPHRAQATRQQTVRRPL